MPNRGTDYLPRPATSLPSNRKGSGTPYSMRAASGCTGFRRTFDSPGMIADGTSRSALRFSRTQVTPSAASARGAGAARQRAGSRGSGTDSTEMPRGRRATQATELDPREAPESRRGRGTRARRARASCPSRRRWRPSSSSGRRRGASPLRRRRSRRRARGAPGRCARRPRSADDAVLEATELVHHRREAVRRVEQRDRHLPAERPRRLEEPAPAVVVAEDLLGLRERARAHVLLGLVWGEPLALLHAPVKPSAAAARDGATGRSPTASACHGPLQRLGRKPGADDIAPTDVGGAPQRNRPSGGETEGRLPQTSSTITLAARSSPQPPASPARGARLALHPARRDAPAGARSPRARRSRRSRWGARRLRAHHAPT